MHLTIPTPCPKNWDTMQPQKEGKFCNSCGETVIDFTEMTDTEVANYFNKRPKNTCGRFTDAQLSIHNTEDIYNIVAKIFRTNWSFIKKTVAAVLLCFAFAQDIQAQASKDTIVVQSACYTLGRVVTNPVSTTTRKSKKLFPAKGLPAITIDKIKIVVDTVDRKEEQNSKTKKTSNLIKNGR